MVDAIICSQLLLSPFFVAQTSMVSNPFPTHHSCTYAFPFGPHQTYVLSTFPIINHQIL